MTGIDSWSKTAASNNQATPNGWPEGQAPSTVNDCGRQMMASLRTWYESAEWINWGDTCVYASSTSFTIAGTDATTRYTTNRRIKAVGSSTGTIYGTVSSSSFSTNTTVNITWDSGSLSNETLTIYFGIINPTNISIVLPTIASGIVAPYAGSSAPSGWLLCDGSAVSRTTYASLFTAISTTHGTGDGSTTFNVPDLRGRAVFGKDNMGGSAASRVTNAVSGITGTTLGAAGGDQNMHGHTHTATDSGHTHNATVYGTNSINSTHSVYGGTDGTSGVNSSIATASSTANVTNSTTGSGTSQNMPPAIILNYIIKT